MSIKWHGPETKPKDRSDIWSVDCCGANPVRCMFRDKNGGETHFGQFIFPWSEVVKWAYHDDVIAHLMPTLPDDVREELKR